MSNFYTSAWTLAFLSGICFNYGFYFMITLRILLQMAMFIKIRTVEINPSGDRVSYVVPFPKNIPAAELEYPFLLKKKHAKLGVKHSSILVNTIIYQVARHTEMIEMTRIM
jgi:hypothetical protein